MSLKTCSTCPSYMTDDDSVRSRFGKAIGVPMCGRFGHVLGRPGEPNNEEILHHFAARCDSHNTAATATPVSITPRVVDVDADTLAGGATGDDIGTCNGCQNLVIQSDVLSRTGFPIPICKAKGTLVFKPVQEAKGCPWAKAGTNSSGHTLVLVDELQPGFRMDSGKKLQAIVGDLSLVEPSTYESDAVVSPEDHDKGVRAWRLFKDDATGKEYYLPIFREEFFTEEEQERIPRTGVPFRSGGPPELYVDHNQLLVRWLKNSYSLDYTMCLTGEPGNGKSQFGIYLAWLMQVPFDSFDIEPDMDVQEFRGHPSVDPVKGDYYVLGRYPRRFCRPGISVSNEYNAGPEPVTFFFRHIFDTGAVQIDYDGGLKVEKDDYHFVLVTANPEWDERNLGTKPLADADAQRLTFAWVAEPPEPVMRYILKERCKLDGYDLPDSTLDKIIKIGSDIRQLSEQRIFPGTWGLRQETKVARMTAHYALLADAYRAAALDSMEPSIREVVIESIMSYER